MSGQRYTPVDHVIDPNCDADRHGFFNAHRYHECICPCDSLTRYETFYAEQLEKKRERRAQRPAPGMPQPVQPANGRGHWPTPKEVAELEKELWKRDDLACRDADPNVFNVIGSGPAARAQAAEARSICSGCSALALCREVGLNVDYEDQVLGGLMYAERVAIRRASKKQQVAA